MCVGEVLLKQWKQGNTSFSKTRKRPLEIGVFFCSFITFIYFPISFHVVPINTKNVVVDVVVGNMDCSLKCFLYGSLTSVIE